MERVSFKVAKYLKEVGYPQYPLIPCYQDDIIKEYIEKREDICDDVPTYACPMYIEVWLWLSREKKITIELFIDDKQLWFFSIQDYVETKSFQDPEKAVIAAIEYLVNENLLK